MTIKNDIFVIWDKQKEKKSCHDFIIIVLPIRISMQILKFIHISLKHYIYFPVLDLDSVLAASDWRPLSVVGASCTLEYLVPSALLHSALPLLGDHLQHPHDLRLPRTDGHQAGTQGLKLPPCAVAQPHFGSTVSPSPPSSLLSLSGILRVSRSGRPSLLQVHPRPALPVSPPPPGVPGAGCGAVVPAGPVPGPAPAGGDSVDLPGPGTLSGQTGFSLPLRPD